MHDIQWWLDRCELPIQRSDGWMAKCPAHDDRQQSLHLSVDAEGTVVVHCFAGCTYGEIVEAAEGHSSTVKQPVITITGSSTLSAATWWERYTGVSFEEWARWGVVEYTTGNAIGFTWPNSKSVKKRASGTKNFFWEPENASTPPLWPMLGDDPGEEMWVTEGESDCGVLRHLGFPAYAVTKGAGGIPDDLVWKAAHDRGVLRVFVVYDCDGKGRQGAAQLAASISRVGVAAFTIPLDTLIDPLLGEKDLRDVWLRVGDEEAIGSALDSLAQTAKLQGSENRIDVTSFLSRPPEERPWLVDNIWLSGSVGMIVGAPKIGKTWLCQDIALSVATGGKFLDQFQVQNSGPVVYVSIEDPNYLLQDRLGKIMAHKGLGGSIVDGRVTFPSQRPPLYLELNRNFLFTSPQSVASLLTYLRYVKDENDGELALVIFDPILRMISGVDEYKASEIASTVFATSTLIQRETGASVLLSHHRAKGQQMGKGSYGSIAFHAFSDGTLFINGDEPANDGWVAVRGEYKSAGETRWSYRFTDLASDYTPEVYIGERSTEKGPSLNDLIVDLLEAAPDGLTVDEIANGLDAPEYKVRECLRQFEANGKFTRVKSDKGSGRGGPKKEKWVAS